MRCFTWALRMCAILGLTAGLCAAHGGTFIGPGSTVPPGGKPPTGPAAAPTGGPTGPGGGGKSGPGPATGAPLPPQAPGLGPSTGGGLAQDRSGWQVWWWLNRAPYLNLKAALARNVVVTGSDGFPLGGGPAEDSATRRSEVRRLRTRAIEVLSTTLPQSHAPDLTTAILLALGKAGSCLAEDEIPALQATIQPLLKDSNQEVAESAAIALGALAYPAPALLLTEILEDSPAGRAAVGHPEVPYRTRAFAAYGLGLIGRRVERQDVRRYIVRHLAQTIESDRTASSDLSVACVQALGLVRVDPRASGEARVGASDSASLSRDAQATMLLQYFTKLQRADLLRAYVPVSLARAVDAGTPEILDASITALCSVSDPRSREPALVQESASMALGSIATQSEAQTKRILVALQESAAHGERLAGNLALISLARVTVGNQSARSSPDPGAPVRSLFIRELTRGPTSTRAWAALALGIYEHMQLKSGGTPSSEARAAVRGALVDRRGPSEIGAYCVAAGLMRDSVARDVLLHILEDGPDDEVRAHAAIGLGLMQDDAAIEPLRKVLAEARYRPLLLRDAAIALGLLGDARAASQLWTMLAEAKSLGAQSAIASGLGFIGDARSIEPLLGLIGNKASSDRTRAFAAAALGNICDDSLLPWNTAYSLDVNYVMPPATLYEPAGAAGLLDLL